MPIREYECEGCGKRTQTFSHSYECEEEIDCPDCGKKAKKVFSRPGHIKFKGGGWTTRRPIEAFPGEPEYTDQWTTETHGLGQQVRGDFDGEE